MPSTFYNFQDINDTQWDNFSPIHGSDDTSPQVDIKVAPGSHADEEAGEADFDIYFNSSCCTMFSDFLWV